MPKNHQSLGGVLPPFFFVKKGGSTPGRPLNSAPLASGFLAILPSLAASLRQPCKDGKNHLPAAPHFRLRPCPANAMDNSIYMFNLPE